MSKVAQYKTFINSDFKDEKVLFEFATDGQIRFAMGGDYYHDKIDERIQGFLQCLTYLGVPYEELEDEEVSWNVLQEHCGKDYFVQGRD